MLILLQQFMTENPAAFTALGFGLNVAGAVMWGVVLTEIREIKRRITVVESDCKCHM